MNKKFFTLLAASLTLGTASAFAQCPQEGAMAVDTVKSGDFYYLQYFAKGGTESVSTDPYFAVTKSASGADSIIVVKPADLTAKGDSAIWQTFKQSGVTYQFQNKATGNMFSLTAGTTNAKLSQFTWNFPSTSSEWQLTAYNDYLTYQVEVSSTNSTVSLPLTSTQGVNVYPTAPGWVKLSASDLNAFYSDYFQLNDKSATSQTEQAQASHKAIESKFFAETSTLGDYIYRLNVLGTDTFLNVDTVYYNRLGLIDSTTQLGGHVLTLDVISSEKSDSSYLFTIWKHQIKDSLAVQTYGIPRIAASGDSFSSTASKDASYTDNGWITLSSYDAGYNETALTAAVGCFNNLMLNPSFSLTKGLGKQIEAGYYWIYQGLAQDTILAAQLTSYIQDEFFTWIADCEGKQWVAAAQWYVPTTSYYPSIFNRESTKQALVNGSTSTTKFYEIVAADGNVIPNAYQVVGASLIDTITMIPIPATITDNIYLGYQRFAESADAQDVTSVSFEFNSVLSNAVLLMEAADTLLTVSSNIDEAQSVIYKMIPVDTFSIGADELRAIAYQFYTIKANKDTAWLAPFKSLSMGAGGTTNDPWTYGQQMFITTDSANAGVYLIRNTYEEDLYQIFNTRLYGDGTDDTPTRATGDSASLATVYPSAERQAMILDPSTYEAGFCRDLLYQVSVAASKAQVYASDNVLEFDGLWSFSNPLAPKYATLKEGYVEISSNENSILSISVNEAGAGTLKGVGELKSEYTEDNFKLLLTCVDTDTIKPLYIISTTQTLAYADTMKEQGVRYYMNTVLNPTSLAYTELDVTPGDSLGFAPAILANDSLATYTVANDSVSVSPVPAASATAFTYAFRINDETPEAYFIEAQLDGSYLSQVNGILTTRYEWDRALLFTVNATSAPTANEGVTVSSIKVIAGEGSVAIAGAAGKKVTITNILGQTVATTVVTSDYATVAAPKGIVVVAVEGETAVKAIVK